MANHRLLLIFFYGGLILPIIASKKIAVSPEATIELQTTIKETLAQTLNEFTINLNQRLYNIYPEVGYGAFSPFGLYLELFLLYNAADGTTQSGISQVMNFPTNLSVSDLSNEFSDIISEIVENRKNGMFEFSTGIFVQSGFPIQSSYQSLVQNKYVTTIDTVNFGNPQSSLDVINSWVSKTTDGQINYFDANLITMDTMMLAINAMYVNAMWKEPYGVYQSFWGNFYPEVDMATQVEFISNIADTQYYSNEIFTTIGLPLVNDLIAYYLVPNNGISLQDVVNNLNPTLLKEMTETEITQRINFTIPKYKIDTGIGFRQVLTELGAADIFNNYANFSNLAEGISLTEIYQKISYTSDENIAWREEEKLTKNYKTVTNSVVVDRPHVLLIYHQLRQFILLSLTIKNPSGLYSHIDFDSPGDVNYYSYRDGYAVPNNRPNYFNPSGLEETRAINHNYPFSPNGLDENRVSNRDYPFSPNGLDEHRISKRNSYIVPNNRPNFINPNGLDENRVSNRNNYISPSGLDVTRFDNRPNFIDPIGLNENRVSNRNNYMVPNNRPNYITPNGDPNFINPNSLDRNLVNNRPNFITPNNLDGNLANNPPNYIIPNSSTNFIAPNGLDGNLVNNPPNYIIPNSGPNYIIPNNGPNFIAPNSLDGNLANILPNYIIPNSGPNYVMPNNGPNFITPNSLDGSLVNNRQNDIIPNNGPNFINPNSLDGNLVNNPPSYIIPNNGPNFINPNSLDGNLVYNRPNYSSYINQNSERVNSYDNPFLRFLIPEGRNDYFKPQLDKSPEIYKRIPILFSM